MEYCIIFIQPQKIMNMPLPTVNARKLSFKNNEYVCWIDIMGTRNIMSESVSKAANSIFKLHSCVMDCIDEDGDATFYPLMDGVFITSPNYGKIFLIIDKLFSRFADIFLTTPNHEHLFVVKGSLSYGPIMHGCDITDEMCEMMVCNDTYKQFILLGLPMIQAYNVEATAPPFGIFIHESARKYKGLQGRYYGWKYRDDEFNLLPNQEEVKQKLMNKVIEYFNWCEQYCNYLEMDENKIAKYKKLAKEYFNRLKYIKE